MINYALSLLVCQKCIKLDCNIYILDILITKTKTVVGGINNGKTEIQPSVTEQFR